MESGRITGGQPGKGMQAFVADFLGDRSLSSAPFCMTPVPADGSERGFFRVVPGNRGRSLIAMENPPISDFARLENTAYLRIGQHLHRCGAHVPEIYRWDLDKGRFLLEDAGDYKLQDAVLEGEDPFPLYTAALETLVRMQMRAARGFDTSWCCQTPAYDRELMLRYESGYFREAFLEGYLGIRGKAGRLERPFTHLADMASRAGAACFVHRDFQSRNLVVTQGGIAVLDWQGGRLGPPGYDLASLLIDPYAGLTPRTRTLLYRVYLKALAGEDPEQASLLEETYPYLAVQRNLQILGAYAFLSRVRGKTFFEAFIPRAVASLKELLKGLPDPELRPLLDLVESLPGPRKEGSIRPGESDAG